MSRIEDGGAVEAGLVERLTKREHTSGPWTVQCTIYEHMAAEIVSAPSGPERGIAQVWSHKNALADASLIAAAPELLDIAIEQAAEITRLRAEVDRKDGALQTALDALDALAFIHDGNPSDAMADMPAIDYARHMLWEARKLAKAAASAARAALQGLPSRRRGSMTNPREDILSLVACPFCGDPMENSVSIIRHVHQGDCIIGQLAYDETKRDRWNCRAAPTPPAAEAPGQEPVAWIAQNYGEPLPITRARMAAAKGDVVLDAAGDWSNATVPLYAAPPTYADAEAKIGALVDALQNLLTLDQRCGWHSKEADAALALLRSLASPAPKEQGQ